MKLDDITTYASTIEALAVAVQGIDPDIAVEALRFVLRSVEPPAIEVRAVPVERLLDAGDGPAVPVSVEVAARLSEHVPESVVEKVVPMSEQVAAKLVAQSWNYASAIKAAKRAVKERGKSAGLEALVELAKKLGTNTRRTDKEGAARSANGQHQKVSDALAADALDWARRHGGRIKTRDYAAARGLTMQAARARFLKLVDQKLMRLEGATNSAEWVLTEKAAA